MDYGLYLSAAGLLTSLHRQDVMANNLANMNTTGFKPDMVTARARLPERLEHGAAAVDPNMLLEQLGGGTLVAPSRISLRQGELTQTKNDFDLAIQGDGFFVVSNGNGIGNDALRFTRDGRFTLNAAGELIMTANHMRVLDEHDMPIRLQKGAKLAIDSEGTIRQNGVPAGKLQISSVADSTQLAKEGDNVMRLVSTARNAKRQAATGAVRQGFIESSAIDPIIALNQMINASKAIEANALMMQYHDNILGQAVNTFGRVA